MALSWEPGAGVSKYRLEWRIGGSADWTELEAEIAGTSHAMAGLKCGTEYRFKLSAYGDGKVYRDTWSDTVKITGLDTDACALPSRMSAPTVEADGTGLIVAWSAPSDDGGAPVTRYQVRYGRVGEPGQDPARWNRVSVTAPATSTAIAGPKANTTYAVQVRAKNRAGWSPWSESGTGATAAPAPKGSVRASPTSISLGATTTVTVYGVSPSDARLKLRYASGLARRSSCVGGGDGVRGASAEITSPAFTGDETIVMTGCAVGTVTVRLLTDQGNDELGSVTIEVTPPPLSLPVVTDHTAAVARKFSATLPEAVGGTSPYTYSVTDLPSWLTFNASTRVLSGRPTAEGEHTVTYRVTDASSATAERTFTIGAALQPAPAPALRAMIDSGRVTLHWNHNIREVTNYQVRYRERAASAWVSETVEPKGPTAAQRFLVNLGLIDLIDGKTFEFQISALGLGVSYAAEWGRWSESVLVTIDAPATPTGLTVDTKTLYSASLSWSPVDGAVYQVSWRRNGTDKFTEGPATTTSSYTVTGLTHSTEYNFRVRSRGDGTRYNNENSSWSDGVNATTLSPPDSSYAEKVSVASSESALERNYFRGFCPALGGYHVEEVSAPSVVVLPDGSRHSSRVEIAREQALLVPGDYCVEARVISVSEPGASALTWASSTHMGTYQLVGFDREKAVKAIKAFDLNALVTFTRYVPATRASPTLETPISHTCTSPCEGGVQHHKRVILSSAVLIHQKMHIFGTHTVTYGDKSWTRRTEASWMPPVGAASSNLGEFAGNVLGELSTYLGDTLTQELRKDVKGATTNE